MELVPRLAISEAVASSMETIFVNRNCAKKLRICSDVALRAGKGSDSDSTPISRSLLVKDDELFYLVLEFEVFL